VFIATPDVVVDTLLMAGCSSRRRFANDDSIYF